MFRGQDLFINRLPDRRGIVSAGGLRKRKGKETFVIIVRPKHQTLQVQGGWGHGKETVDFILKEEIFLVF